MQEHTEDLTRYSDLKRYKLKAEVKFAVGILAVITFTTITCSCLRTNKVDAEVIETTAETEVQITPTPTPELIAIPSITPIPTKAYELSEESRYTLVSGGSYYITNYDACVSCCGNTLGITASGVHVSDSPIAHTVAVDTSVIPFGTRFIIPAISGNEVYIAQDRGSAVIGNHIDIYQLTHEIALNSPSGYYEIFFIQE